MSLMVSLDTMCHEEEDGGVKMSTPMLKSLGVRILVGVKVKVSKWRKKRKDTMCLKILQL